MPSNVAFILSLIAIYCFVSFYINRIFFYLFWYLSVSLPCSIDSSSICLTAVFYWFFLNNYSSWSRNYSLFFIAKRFLSNSFWLTISVIIFNKKERYRSLISLLVCFRAIPNALIFKNYFLRSVRVSKSIWIMIAFRYKYDNIFQLRN